MKVYYLPLVNKKKTHSSSTTMPQHKLPMWPHANLRWKCCLTLTKVQTLQHQITTFFKSWFISCTDGSLTMWIRLKMAAEVFSLPLNHPNGTEEELSRQYQQTIEYDEIYLEEWMLFLGNLFELIKAWQLRGEKKGLNNLVYSELILIIYILLLGSSNYFFK